MDELQSKCCHCGPLSMPVFISIFDDDEAEKAGEENSMQFLFSAAVAAARTLSASHNSLSLPVIANIIKNPWLKIRSFLTIFSLHSSHLISFTTSELSCTHLIFMDNLTATAAASAYLISSHFFYLSFIF